MPRHRHQPQPTRRVTTINPLASSRSLLRDRDHQMRIKRPQTDTRRHRNQPLATLRPQHRKPTTLDQLRRTQRQQQPRIISTKPSRQPVLARNATTNRTPANNTTHGLTTRAHPSNQAHRRAAIPRKPTIIIFTNKMNATPTSTNTNSPPTTNPRPTPGQLRGINNTHRNHPAPTGHNTSDRAVSIPPIHGTTSLVPSPTPARHLPDPRQPPQT